MIYKLICLSHIYMAIHNLEIDLIAQSRKGIQREV